MFDDELARQVVSSRENDEALEGLIEQNKQFILRVASKSTGRFITDGDDEYSVAMIAFYEAVKAYSAEKGPFPQFAALVIKRRLLDHMTSQSRFSKEIPVEPYSMDGEIEEETENTPIQLAVRAHSMDSAPPVFGTVKTEDIPGSITVKDEIDVMQEILSNYGFSFYDLIEASPKAEKTKRSTALVVADLIGEDYLFEFMQKNRALPIKELCADTKVNRKIIERHRKYIIAAAEILRGDFPMLEEYLGFVKEVIK
ncbi:MAG: RNA polymerase subunit sigma [Lachnospiraceae bacterium]|nr:RNA polymerase subunit sigma [Lachnospiraceae bacterium]